MPSTGNKLVTIAAAAAALDVTPRTIQAWIAQGAPVARPGRRGGGRPTLVDVAALLAWRDRGGDPVRLDKAALAAGIWRAFTAAPESYGAPAWVELGLSRRQAAAVLVEAFRAIHVELTGRPPPDELPAECEALFRIAAGSP